MSKVLGLDLGTASIGWALVDGDTVLGIGSRIIPLSVDDANEFSKGQAISKNAARTQKRTQRKGYDRYQQRRSLLTDFLKQHDMLPDAGLIGMPKIELWQLRAKAVSAKLSPSEIGRVLYHLNQKRGYKHSKADQTTEDAKEKEYVANVNNRHKAIIELGLTIGQFFYDNLKKDPFYRTKEQVFPRKAYQQEFDAIIAQQQMHYSGILTDSNVDILRNTIIYYQRGLKSCKHLVSMCEFEKHPYKNTDGKVVFDGPKVAPRTSPLFQVCTMWENLNNIHLTNRRAETYPITAEQKIAIFNHLDNHEKLTLTDLYKILDITKAEGWWGGKAIGKGLAGNTTKMKLKKALAGYDGVDDFLKFELKNTEVADTITGEVRPIISTCFEKEPLYRLWHTLYSIKDREELRKTLKNNFDIDDNSVVDSLYSIDFTTAGFGNKSAKAIRRILPFLENGLMYSEACLAAGFRHSESLTTAENDARELLERIKPIRKNELRQPVVEKILNQMINLVNALIAKHGAIDEIRIELARELKQSRDQRNTTDRNIRDNERNNKRISELVQQYCTPTRSRIQKYKMWEESQHKCFYCGQPVNVTEFLRGFDVEVEHVIPKSMFFDDGFSNKVCACRACNQEKNNRTAFDFMSNKPTFENYLNRVEEYYKSGKISKTKRDRLLTSQKDIPNDFIDRQLRESQYIARKSKEILSSVCRNVWATSGSVTDFVRHAWGWDAVLHDLNFERYEIAGLTQTREITHKDGSYIKTEIKDWSKRLDHRHHAIDALTIAYTKQSFIQRINNLNTQRDAMFAELSKQSTEHQEKHSLLQQWIIEQPHLTTTQVAEAVSNIFVSFKAGKKAASTGKRVKYQNGKKIVLQTGIIIPRGALHEESVYGSIARYDKNSKGETVVQNSIVMKYPVTSIVKKDIDFIVDGGIKELIRARFDSCGGNEKQVWKDLETNPLLFNGAPIRSVRCFTGLKPESTAHVDRGIVKLGNNHHIAIYVDKDGKRYESCVTFWQAVERTKSGLPVIITNPEEVWQNLPENLSEQLIEQLPHADWNLELSMQQNEMFILGLEPEALAEALRNHDNALLSRYLYKIQNISSKAYRFCLHNMTQYDLSNANKVDKRYFNVTSMDGLTRLNPQKVKINLLGEIVL